MCLSCVSLLAQTGRLNFITESVCSKPATGPFALLKPVNVTENLLSARDGFCVPGQWSFVSSDFDVLLPCVVPFVIAASDLTPARQLYAENELAQALRFVELSRMTKTTDSIEQWNLRLIAAMLQLESRQPNEAWRTLQSALSWRNRLKIRLCQQICYQQSNLANGW